MKRKTIWKLHLLLAVGVLVLIALATVISVSRPSPAEENIIKEPCIPTQDNVISAARGMAVDGSGETGRAELRTPEDMERAERDGPQVRPPPGGVPFMPTEEDYWEKKAEADALQDQATAQDKASALEAEKAERERLKISDPC